ncbi:HGGxSTG domain-containing protein [Bradyrhizobium sp.]|uniref:HGGxSTG domain-containing protein n=1 Tax=Bradyrhizobium sp. TaxID=376 RepID=UPI003520A49C
MSNHARNIDPMLASCRCGARTRAGGLCRAPAMRGKRRCRKHGGAPGSGAPSGNRNALRHGLFTGEAIAERRRIGDLLGEARKLLKEMK